MTPNLASDQTGALYEEDDALLNTIEVAKHLKKTIPVKRKHEYVWRNIIMFAYLHAASLYGLYLAFTSAKILTLLFSYVLFHLGALGITAGAHRLWSHRSYKAKWPLRLFLTFCNTIAFQDAVVDWARDHRVHHKYSETDADPHNATRGFFFAHIGWLLVRKHPDVKAKGKGIDLSDLYSDPILRFQKKYYSIIMPICCFIMPTFVPYYFWNESLQNSFFVASLLRYCLNLNVTWLVNSAAHLWGPKPYDKHINPAENFLVAQLAMGEGWHNYHHTFPWDYKTSELGTYTTNWTTFFLDGCAKLGLAYDMKTVSEEMIQKRIVRTGDGSHSGHHSWGWGDEDQLNTDKTDSLVMSKKET